MQDTKLKPPGAEACVAIYLVTTRHCDEADIGTMADLLAIPAGALG